MEDHACCQCTCPVLRDGTQRHGPQKRKGGTESLVEYQKRVDAFLESLPWGVSTRCDVHNSPDAPRRG